MIVLFVTGKWPISLTDIDGGCLTTINILESIPKDCDIDILLPKAFSSIVIPYARRVLYFDVNKSDYLANYNNKDKFSERLKWSSIIASTISDLVPHYDKVIIQHCFFALGLDKLLNPSMLRKILVFPMFLTPEYKISGEIVPPPYTKGEEEILKSGIRILTPSGYSKRSLLSFYPKVNPDNIIVFPRYIDEIFSQRKTRPHVHNPIRLIYVASIKLQKNNMEVLDLANELYSRNIDFSLDLVGAIQNTEYANTFFSKLNASPFKDKVTFHEPISQAALADLYSHVDLSISVSNCETFGRAIIEGLYSGLPAIVKDSIDCFHDVVGENAGIIYAYNTSEMAEEIINCRNKDYYMEQSHKAHQTGNRFSKKILQTQFWEVMNED